MDATTEALQDTDVDPRLDRDTSNCSIARTLEVVGEKWTILILREVWYGSSRFTEFERVLGCPRNLLAARLRMLVEEGILTTETYKEPGSRSRLKYVITPKGMDLVPAVMGLLQWGDRYRADSEGPAMLSRHRGCGAHVGAQIRCDRGHAVQPEDIESIPGPAFRLKPAE
ncbi:winged helix-turn-helix transcriptional regulator [Streptomyces stelliscabiei]|uniref:winged helix-turn-helix transcriptional regulator n=1 Tax=Streptomyces stelliscabiei TaxID=146820 RepID=UPI0029B24FA2|nr:helix-turn-helix domain-containing protein [Streptomyces stelliscabiei]MDX2556430.1 helix-turn-helix domain-containing protein [Streptomyces stelliscabiei]MDX2615110.1 helix-turn-helix domain-containing protein [Streptomyces stelliscabiei]MDX2640285.1 helix-turn-helix domain-containing protein [Streptomyces stelliscabiei]MDX2665794.1 helix-turn-helix domain-containing protein [Streptomyces stelliscabiei]MDX2716994.1 helix-turn-helix domain-containing protein [Streptomyces stelliscabiei]